MVLINIQIDLDILDDERQPQRKARFKNVQRALKEIENNANSVKDLVEVEGLPNVYKLKETDD